MSHFQEYQTKRRATKTQTTDPELHMNFVKALAAVVTVVVAVAGAATNDRDQRRRRLCVVACGHKPLSKFSERDCTQHGKRQLFVFTPFLHFRHHMKGDRKATGITRVSGGGNNLFCRADTTHDKGGW